MNILFSALKHFAFTIYCTMLLTGAIVTYYTLRKQGVETLLRWIAVTAILVAGCGLYVLFVKFFFQTSLDEREKQKSYAKNRREK